MKFKTTNKIITYVYIDSIIMKTFKTLLMVDIGDLIFMSIDVRWRCDRKGDTAFSFVVVVVVFLFAICVYLS